MPPFLKRFEALLLGLAIGWAKLHRDEAVAYVQKTVPAGAAVSLDHVNAAIESIVPSPYRPVVDMALKAEEANLQAQAVTSAPQAVDFVIGLLKKEHDKLIV